MLKDENTKLILNKNMRKSKIKSLIRKPKKRKQERNEEKD